MGNMDKIRFLLITRAGISTRLSSLRGEFISPGVLEASKVKIMDALRLNPKTH